MPFLSFYKKSIFWQIGIDLILIAFLAVAVISVFNKGLLDQNVLPYFSLSVSVCLAIRVIYLIIVVIKGLMMARWGLFFGSFIHMLIIGGIFYASLYLLLLSVGALGGGTAGH